jgi:hypothetical protein
VEARKQLADFPRSAPRGRAPGTRRLIVSPYVLTYREAGMTSKSSIFGMAANEPSTSPMKAVRLTAGSDGWNSERARRCAPAVEAA